ncbi:MAG: tryptophan synthase subunit alpha [Idiomarina sp.]|nr:MAG: tryptophan synthase subunit alpha [Idiomarina sp.]
MNRYQHMFEQLKSKRQGAFVPFVTLGDPTPELSLKVIEALIDGGADALELGLPFSDPVADGPTIQKANIRALAAGTRISDAFAIIQQVRSNYPELPIGLLVYANLVVSNGTESFYQRCAEAGVDSVLIADVPVREGLKFAEAAKRHGVAPIYIAPPDASEQTLANVAKHSEGYVYLLSRAGVTGAETQMQAPASAVIEHLRHNQSAPPLLGFGIAKPEHVKSALDAGAAGAICGSAIVKILEQHQHDEHQLVNELAQFVQTMKAATSIV